MSAIQNIKANPPRTPPPPKKKTTTNHTHKTKQTKTNKQTTNIQTKKTNKKSQIILQTAFTWLVKIRDYSTKSYLQIEAPYTKRGCLITL